MVIHYSSKVPSSVGDLDPSNKWFLGLHKSTPQTNEDSNFH